MILLALTCTSVFTCVGLAAAATAGAQTLSQMLTRAMVRTSSQSGGLVIDATTGQTLFAHAAGVPRMPASVEKLYTTSTALLEYGDDGHLDTTVYGVGSLNAGTWDGTLYLRGGGDPTFGDKSFDQRQHGTGATVQNLVSKLKAAGINRVVGRILGDGSYFDALRGTPATGWAANTEVEGELSGLSYDAGFTSSAETTLQAKPVAWAAQAFKAALVAGGISVSSSTTVATGHTPANATPLASVDSPPLSSLVELTNSPSDNFFAETLLKDLGAAYGAGGSTADGASVVRSTLRKQFDVTPRFDDGSGLARYDRTSPDQVVTLLKDMAGNAAFYNSLAIAGVRGTLQDEMNGTKAANNCRGKTGTLHDVANLVGYCRARNGDALIFAFLMNGLHNADYGHDVEASMGVDLANYAG